MHLFLVSAVWSYRLAKMWGLKKHEVVEGPAMGRGVMVARRTLEGYHKIGARKFQRHLFLRGAVDRGEWVDGWWKPIL